MATKWEVLKLVVETTGVDEKFIMSPSKMANHTRARVLLYLALRMMGYSVPQIGQFVGRHHSTVAHMTERATMEEQDKAAALLEALGETPLEMRHKNIKRSEMKVRVKPSRVLKLVEVRKVPNYRSGKIEEERKYKYVIS